MIYGPVNNEALILEHYIDGLVWGLANGRHMPALSSGAARLYYSALNHMGDAMCKVAHPPCSECGRTLYSDEWATYRDKGVCIPCFEDIMHEISSLW